MLTEVVGSLSAAFGQQLRSDLISLSSKLELDTIATAEHDAEVKDAPLHVQGSAERGARL